MNTNTIEAVLERAPLASWQRLFQVLDAVLAAEPWTILKNYHFIGIEYQSETYWLQVLGSGGESRGLNLHRGTAGLAALLRILAGTTESDAEAQVLMRGLDCLSLGWESKAQLDELDIALLKAAGRWGAARKDFPQVRDCAPGWYPWFPTGPELELARAVLEMFLASLPAIKLRPAVLEPEDDDLVGVICQNRQDEWVLVEKTLPDFDVLDEVPQDAFTLDGRTVKRVTELVARLPKLGTRLELGCIVLANATEAGDGGRAFFPQVVACVEAKTHALLAHNVLSPAELTPSAWRDCLLDGIEALGQIPGRVDTDDKLAAAAVHSISDLLGCEHHPDSRLKALDTVERAIDRLL